MKSKTFFRKSLCCAAISMAIGAPVSAAGIDVVFKIDESGSMGDDIADVKNNVVTIFNALPGGSAVGLVGYGAFASTAHHPTNGLPHVHTPLTTDPNVFANAVNQLIASGGFEPGYYAVKLSAEDNVYQQSLKFSGAPYCNILITDETPDQGLATRDEAIAAMNARGGIFFGILPSDLFTEAQPLADATGGKLFDLTSFRQDAKPVIEAVLAACVEAAAPVKIDIKPTSCPNPFQLKQKGVVPAAVLGTDTFDVTKVKPETLKLNGDCPALRWSLEDVATPYDGEFSEPPLETECTMAGADGFKDLTVKFDSQCAALTQGPVKQREVRLWTITGKYLDDQGKEVDFEAKDVVRVMP